MTVACPDTRPHPTPDAPDYSRFADAVADATAAFGRDVSYAVAIARAAVTIARKRAAPGRRRCPG